MWLYLWEGLSNIFNGYFKGFFSSAGNIWDKIGYVSFSNLKVDEEKILRFLKIVLWVNVIIIIYALLQKYAGFPVIFKKLFTGDMARFKGYHSHPLRFAGYLSTVFIIGFSFAVFYSRKLLIPVVIIFLGVILNGSRTYWFSVVVVIGVISMLKSFRVFLISVIGGGVVVGGLFLFVPELNKRVESAFESKAGVELVDMVSGEKRQFSNMELRKNFWKAGI